jgi:selenide,water dikinase
METMDDAGVFRISDDMALVQTVDFFSPVVADPRTFGRIVAANCLSDVWAMGGRALTAMNLLCFPTSRIPETAVEDLMQGASEKLVEAGVVLVGGHTMEQDELVYGMSITGTIDPGRALRNSMARIGDRLILTKPIGSGVVTTANMAVGMPPAILDPVVASMERLNRYASEVLYGFDTSALTDITGFGLLGHALAMARSGEVGMRFHAGSIPFFEGAAELTVDHLPKGSRLNRQYAEPFTGLAPGLDGKVAWLVFDAQTSGGLLAAVRQDQAEDALDAVRSAGDTDAAIVGEVTGLEPDVEGETVYLTVTA